MTESLDTLSYLPRPRRIAPAAGGFPIGPTCHVVCLGHAQQLLPIAEAIQSAVRQATPYPCPITAGGPGQPHPGAVTVSIDGRHGAASESYRLIIDAENVALTAADTAGAFYAAMTLKQILRQCPRTLPSGMIDDRPDFAVRGVMLDISRDKVPTMETLYAFIDQLAEWKFNHFELYTEHTFAHRHHPEPSAQATPMTGEQIMRLDRYARQRHIELVPNQNCFGHFHRWLDVPHYRHLAECPDGFDYPWGGHRDGPYSLDPTNSKSLELIESMLDELLPHFQSQKLNVGCDEVWDLGRGRSAAACAAHGRERVYFDYLLGVHKLVSAHNHTMHFWSDIVIQKPELLKELPDDVIALEWGYEVGDPFEEHTALLADAGTRFYICPGTSSWRSFLGRTDNCLANIADAVVQGIDHGAEGLLVTEWGDQGYWQYLPFSFLGLSASASQAWCHQTHDDDRLVDALDVHVFQDTSRRMGRLVYDLGNAYHLCGKPILNGTPLFPFLEQSWPERIPDDLTEQRIEACVQYVEQTAAAIDDVRMQRPDAPLVDAEFRNSLRMFHHACARATAMHRGRQNDSATKLDLASDLRTIIAEHRRLWLARNREGGLHRSAAKLLDRLEEYEGPHDALA